MVDKKEIYEKIIIGKWLKGSLCDKLTFGGKELIFRRLRTKKELIVCLDTKTEDDYKQLKKSLVTLRTDSSTGLLDLLDQFEIKGAFDKREDLDIFLITCLTNENCTEGAFLLGKHYNHYLSFDDSLSDIGEGKLTIFSLNRRAPGPFDYYFLESIELEKLLEMGIIISKFIDLVIKGDEKKEIAGITKLVRYLVKETPVLREESPSDLFLTVLKIINRYLVLFILSEAGMLRYIERNSAKKILTTFDDEYDVIRLDNLLEQITNEKGETRRLFALLNEQDKKKRLFEFSSKLGGPKNQTLIVPFIDSDLFNDEDVSGKGKKRIITAFYDCIDKKETFTTIFLENFLKKFLSKLSWSIQEDQKEDLTFVITPEVLSALYEKVAVAFASLDKYPEYRDVLKGDFEKKIAEIFDPKNKKNIIRKENGIYYTPRHVTEYVAVNTIVPRALAQSRKDSLKLPQVVSLADLKELFLPTLLSQPTPFLNEFYRIIKNISVLDPAVGSGSFTMSAADVLYILRRALVERLGSNETYFETAKAIVQENVYGVDILDGAISVCKMRMWVWILTKTAEFFKPEDIALNQFYETINQIELPKIEYNFLVGNSLVGYARFPAKRSLDDWFEESSGRLSELKEQYENGKLSKSKIETLRTEVNQELTKKFSTDFKTSETKLAERKVFHWCSELWKVIHDGGFDVVIGNPPYIKEDVNKKIFDEVKETSLKRYYQGKMDFWYFFTCRAIDLMKDEGLHGFIAQNNWPTSDGAENLRKKIMPESELQSLIDFNEFQVFPEASIQTMIFITKKQTPNHSYLAKYYRVCKKHISWESLMCSVKKPDKNVELINAPIRPYENPGKALSFNSPEVSRLLNKIEKKENFKLKEAFISSGIDTLQETVTEEHLKTLKDPKLGKGTGVFVLSPEELKELKLSKVELKKIRPYYTPSEISRYVSAAPNKYWLIYADKEVRSNIEKYPNLRKHLDKFKEIMTSDFKPYGLHRPRDVSFFEGEKILCLRKTKKPSFTYTEFPCYVSRAFIIIKLRNTDLKFLTCLFNSQLAEFWLYEKGKRQGNQLQVDNTPLLSFPIYLPNNDNPEDSRKRLTVVRLFESLSPNLPEDASSATAVKQRRLQDEMDELIYSLYNISKEEQALIEKTLKKYSG